MLLDNLLCSKGSLLNMHRLHFTGKNIALDIVLLLELLIFIFTIQWQFRGNVLNHTPVQRTDTATVFIPGFGGNAVSTDDFIDQFSQHKLATRTLRIYISNNNKVSTMGNYHPVAKDNPMVQLVFQDVFNTQHETHQMIYVMRYLRQKYHIKNVNFIGHSSGGNIAFGYMLENPQAQGVPVPRKLVTIGANYNPNDDASRLPKTLHILNIAGEIWNAKTDGEVPNKIVKPMGKLVRHHVGAYRYYVYSSNPLDAEHSMLHENPRLDKIIAEFLWDNKYPAGAEK